MSDRYIVHTEDLYKFAVETKAFDFEDWGTVGEEGGYDFFSGCLGELRPAFESYLKYQCGFWLDRETKTLTFNTMGLELAVAVTTCFFHEYHPWGAMNFAQQPCNDWMLGVDDPCHSIGEFFGLGSDDGDVDYCAGHPDAVFEICTAWAKAHKDQGNDPHADDWKKKGSRLKPYNNPTNYPTGEKLNFFLYSDKCKELRQGLDSLYLHYNGKHREAVAKALAKRGK